MGTRIEKEKWDNEALKIFLENHTGNLSPTQLKTLFAEIQNAELPEHLSIPLQNHLDIFRLPHEVMEIVKLQAERTIRNRCETKQILQQDQLDALVRLLKIAREYHLNLVSIVSGLLETTEENANQWELYASNFDKMPRDHLQAIHTTLKNKLQDMSQTLPCDLTLQYCRFLTKSLCKLWAQGSGIQVLKLDNKQTLVYKKPVIILSQSLTEIENYLSQAVTKTEEVHIIAQEVIHIDVSMDNSKWHGINVVAMAKRISCAPPKGRWRWDVSGLSQISGSIPNLAKPGTEVCPNGENGKDGQPGENGGSLLLLANKFEMVEYLVGISNGGNGQDGQSGGSGFDGQNGQNGCELSLDEVNQKFNTFTNGDCKTISLQNLNSCLSHVNFSIPYKIRHAVTGQLDIDKLKSENFYIDGITKTGLRVQVGYYKYRFPSTEHAFILFRGGQGLPGQLGGFGGNGGSGGVGGRKGSIRVEYINSEGSNNDMSALRIETEAVDGTDGQNGEEGRKGQDGTPGRPGLDAGYYEVGSSKIQVGDGKFEVKTYDYGCNGMVWSHYHQSYITLVEVRGEEADDTLKLGNEPTEKLNVVVNPPNKETREQNVCKNCGKGIDIRVNKGIRKNVVLDAYRDWVCMDLIAEAVKKMDADWWKTNLLSLNENHQN